MDLASHILINFNSIFTSAEPISLPSQIQSNVTWKLINNIFIRMWITRHNCRFQTACPSFCHRLRNSYGWFQNTYVNIYYACGSWGPKATKKPELRHSCPNLEMSQLPKARDRLKYQIFHASVPCNIKPSSVTAFVFQCALMSQLSDVYNTKFRYL